MRILYVTSLWSGLRPLLFEGAEDTKGMPAFIEPLRYLVEHGHDVELVINTKGGLPDLDVRAPWLREIPIFGVDGPRRRRRSQRRMLRALVEERLAQFAPEFLYLHGTAVSPFWRTAKRLGLPCGQRVYGVDNHLDTFGRAPRWWIRLRKPGTWNAFNGEKAFVIATRDGSRGDLVQQKLCPRPQYAFHFLLNGFVPPDTPSAPPSLPSVLNGDPYLFCPARFSYMKGKVRTVEFLKRIHDAGWPQVRLVVAGQLKHQDESDHFWQRVEEYELQDRVEHLGEIPREEVRRRCSEALAVLSLYRFSNLSNVTIETLSSGGLLVTLDDGSVDGIADHDDNALVCAGVEQAATCFSQLLDQPEHYARLRERAAERARSEFLPWIERARLEEGFIEGAIKKV